MQYLKRLLAAMVASVCLVACTSVNKPVNMPVNKPDESYVQAKDREASKALAELKLVVGDPAPGVWNSAIYSFHSINEMNLLVYARINDPYLVKLADPCIELPYALTVGVVTHGSVVKNYDTVVVNSPTQTNERCSIKGIYRLNPQKADAP